MSTPERVLYDRLVTLARFARMHGFRDLGRELIDKAGTVTSDPKSEQVIYSEDVDARLLEDEETSERERETNPFTSGDSPEWNPILSARAAIGLLFSSRYLLGNLQNVERGSFEMWSPSDFGHANNLGTFVGASILLYHALEVGLKTLLSWEKDGRYPLVKNEKGKDKLTHNLGELYWALSEKNRDGLERSFSLAPSVPENLRMIDVLSDCGDLYHGIKYGIFSKDRCEIPRHLGEAAESCIQIIVKNDSMREIEQDMREYLQWANTSLVPFDPPMTGEKIVFRREARTETEA